MLSNKMMPAVGALVPVYVMAQTAGLLDSLTALIVVFTLSNLPIMVWMLYSGFKEIPPDILEAGRSVLGQALGRLADGDRAHRRRRLVQPEAARPGPDLRRGEVGQDKQE